MVTSYQDYTGIISDYVYGHNLVELMTNKTGFTMTSKKQEEILRRFRRGEFNVLVATSVVEEGLDVRKCNIVVRFDGISNYREYVQSKGRARAPNSQFFVLAESCEEEDVRIGIEVIKFKLRNDKFVNKRMCLIDTNSRNDRLGRLGIVFD